MRDAARVLAAALFSDLVNSTRHAADLGDSDGSSRFVGVLTAAPLSLQTDAPKAPSPFLVRAAARMVPGGLKHGESLSR